MKISDFIRFLETVKESEGDIKIGTRSRLGAYQAITPNDFAVAMVKSLNAESRMIDEKALIILRGIHLKQ